MKGYKALNQDMKAIYGNGMQFELGKKYTVSGEVIPSENGFHFCEKIEYLNICYDISDSRIFEIEAYGDIRSDNKKYVAEGIQLVRELSKEEINDYFRQNQQEFINEENRMVRIAVAQQGYGLDKLLHDEDCYVREAVAKQGYGLDVLVYDEKWQVRSAVAEQGYGLDILIRDANWIVREAVAKQGYGLGALVYDEDYDVRKAVAEQGYGLDRLINDEQWQVRAAVAKQGYGLDVLINDED